MNPCTFNLAFQWINGDLCAAYAQVQGKRVGITKSVSYNNFRINVDKHDDAVVGVEMLGHVDDASELPEDTTERFLAEKLIAAWKTLA